MDDRRRLFPLLLILAGVAVYSNSFSGSFQFDDYLHIVCSPKIRNLFHPEHYLPGTTRPMVALTLAFNYAVGRLAPEGYHALNLLIHLLAALTLYGLLRRTLETNRLRERYRGQSVPLAFAVTLLWTVHPLQTESVTYIIQRAESLAGLFFLLTLYGLNRHAEHRSPAWRRLAFLACALGMGTKPVMVFAPLTALVYDRIFLSSCWRETFRARWKLHAGLFATWALLALVLFNSRSEYLHSAGFSYQKVSLAQYARTQPAVVLHYLRLVFWPHPLVLDYQWPVATHWREILPSSLALLILMLITGWALWLPLKEAAPGASAHRRAAAGFLGAWFFLTLAPSSSIIPIADLAFEHRMYLPLAAILAPVVFLIHGRVSRKWATALLIACTVALGTRTFLRNGDYRTEETLWRQTLLHGRPSARAYNNLGAGLLKEKKWAEAVSAFSEALRLDPSSSSAHSHLGLALSEAERPEEALPYFQQALRLDPKSAQAHNGLGITLHQLGRFKEADEEYHLAIELDPYSFPEAYNNLGQMEHRGGNLEKALRNYEQSFQLDPSDAAAPNNIGTVLFQQKKWEEAAQWFRRAARTDPGFPEAWNNLGSALFLQGKTDEALSAYSRALELKPGYLEARRNLRNLLSQKNLLSGS